jgi:UDP-N-acetylglucosamine 2-epimerase (non-hydrolysing)
MRIGMTVPPQATLETTLSGFELAEGLGVDSAWSSQPPGGLDALAVLALAAAMTRDVRLGTAVIPTFPSHPLVTARAARTADAAAPGRVVLGVSSYLEFMSLVRGAAAAITDSAGVQEETTFLRVPCLTLRPVTERPITVTSGSNRLVRADELASAVQDALARGPYAGELPPLWDGASGPRIAGIIAGWLATRY